jgi:hypothetical protein
MSKFEDAVAALDSDACEVWSATKVAHMVRVIRESAYVADDAMIDNFFDALVADDYFPVLADKALRDLYALFLAAD